MLKNKELHSRGSVRAEGSKDGTDDQEWEGMEGAREKVRMERAWKDKRVKVLSVGLNNRRAWMGGVQRG